MAIITSNASGAWATGATWVGGVKPADGDSVVIAASHSILMDEDQSAMTGMLSVTIQGHATTPGMLYFKDGTSGHLKIRTAYNLVGTSGAAKGRLLANSDGIWGNTGALAFAGKAIIDLGATSNINAQYLDIALYCYNSMTNKYLRTYGVRHTVTGSAAADTLTKASHGLANGTPVMIMSSGTIPSGLVADYVYHVVNTATNTFQLAAVSGGTAIDLTSDGTGTIEVYTGAAFGANPVNVFEDVTVETGWVTTAGHNAVVMVNSTATANYDQQRLTMSTIASGAITLSAALDSTQYPGARIFLVSRNVSIRSACTSSVSIVDYGSATTSGGVFQCEIRSTAGTGTTFYGYGVIYGTGHTLSGTISGCSYGVIYGTGHTLSGTISGCNYGVYSGTGHTLSGTISGCNSGVIDGTGHTLSGTVSGCSFGINSGTGHTLSGTISGCNYGINSGTGHTLSGTISGCSYGINYGTGHTLSGTISGCNYGIYYGTGYTLSGTISGCNYTFRFGVSDTNPLSVRVLGSASLPNPPVFYNRNTSGIGSQGKHGVFCEDYNKVLGASYAYLPTGDVIKNTATVRAGGAVSSLEVVPLSNCAVIAPIQIFEWTELSVAASAQNKSVYIRADAAWSVYPTATELYIEAEYISNGTTFATTIVKSTAVLNHASNWIQFTIPGFTPAVVGHVRYRAFLKKYEASRKIYCDAMLVSS
jgi:hypothetical protein